MHMTPIRTSEAERVRVAVPGVVLIVEDHPLVQITATALIEDAGMETVVAGDADEALAILQTREDVRALFTDIDMPGSMDGLALALLVHARWPDIRLVVTSGGLPPAGTALPGGVSFFQKPYDYGIVIDALKAAAAV